jgi:hypothetical protein
MVTPHVTEILPPWISAQARERRALDVNQANQRDLVIASLLLRPDGRRGSENGDTPLSGSAR